MTFPKISVFIFLLSIIGGTSSATSAIADDAHHHHHPSAENSLDKNRPTALAGESIYHLSDSWKSQDDRSVSIAALAGQPAVIAMIYTSCQSACPMTLADLKRIEAALPPDARSKVRFAIFSFDSKRDTPAKLAEFAKSRSLDTKRWSLYHGSKAAVRKLAAVLGIQYKQDAAGDFDHSNVITVVDAGGIIRHQQIGLGKEPKETTARILALLK